MIFTTRPTIAAENCQWKVYNAKIQIFITQNIQIFSHVFDLKSLKNDRF
jgi:hypothetical protein